MTVVIGADLLPKLPECKKPVPKPVSPTLKYSKSCKIFLIGHCHLKIHVLFQVDFRKIDITKLFGNGYLNTNTQSSSAVCIRFDLFIRFRSGLPLTTTFCMNITSDKRSTPPARVTAPYRNICARSVKLVPEQTSYRFLAVTLCKCFKVCMF